MSAFFLFFVFSTFVLVAFSIDPYKVLGVDRDASQRDIQRAFHKLSLKYHPDKNNDKSAQAKFSEINNAYEILSDEEKRKNYDLYGDEKGGPNLGSGNPGGPGDRSTYFTYGGPGSGNFNFRPGGSHQARPSFGNPSGSSSSFSFDFSGSNFAENIFSTFFGGGNPNGGNLFGGFGSSQGPKSGHGSTPPSNVQPINSKVFAKEVADEGLTWLLLFYTPSSNGYENAESILEDVANSLHGALKAGSVNCKDEKAFCKERGVWPLKSNRIFVYSYRSNEKGSLVEYKGDWNFKNLKSFCQDHLPRFSKRVELTELDHFLRTATNDLPKVILLSRKKETPVIWRVLSGLYHKRYAFYDTEVHDSSDPKVRSLGVKALPAILGMMSNGQKHVLSSGIVVKDLKNGVSELRGILENFEKKNKKAGAFGKTTKSSPSEARDEKVPLLEKENVETVCGESAALCIIGVFRSSRSRESLASILSTMSQKTLTRGQYHGGRDPVSYCLLDASRQAQFLNAFDKSGFKSQDKLLVAYKPRRGKFVVFSDDFTLEEVERFIGSVLNGDTELKKILRKPELR
ncbi:hypothetical protein AMTRI_Chr08g166970 [Amborella trichopoda]|uniref:J domain-containing protein n=1 Tax=Amborella trichopoda TaxID=13333 RepID=W1P625_AMBTC|nr:dnaJ protein ERDJ3A [Amborella trichopoda]ERN05312.1 hypothetical protein AMTR_s00007p00161340 [Amborella trichopoda]|eukprot:XP_006843637.1 dnaJ protein ERDJ3A [Amborella trichopoda]